MEQRRGLAGDDPILSQLEKASPYFDAGHIKGWRPSSIAVIRYCALVTSNQPGAQKEAIKLALGWLAKGRERWRAGYSANPFSDEPTCRNQEVKT